MRRCPDPEAREWKPPILDVDGETLSLVLEEILADSAGGTGRIGAVRREANRLATQSPVDSVRLETEDGIERRLFVKYLGEETRGDPDKIGPEREVALYRGPLAVPGLPVPACLAARWSAGLDRWVLALEEVPAWDLRYRGLAHWHRAVERLADLHRWFGTRQDELLATGVLGRLGRRYFAHWMGCAASAVSIHSPGLAGRVSDLVGRAGDVAEVLASTPATLIHNDLSPKNVLVEGAEGRPGRVWFVDWEMAAVGPAALDVVHLVHGLGVGDAGDLLDRWAADLAGTGLVPQTGDARERLFAACEVHHLLYLAAHCRRWGLSGPDVEGFLDQAETALSRAFSVAEEHDGTSVSSVSSKGEGREE